VQPQTIVTRLPLTTSVAITGLSEVRPTIGRLTFAVFRPASPRRPLHNPRQRNRTCSPGRNPPRDLCSGTHGASLIDTGSPPRALKRRARPARSPHEIAPATRPVDLELVGMPIKLSAPASGAPASGAPAIGPSAVIGHWGHGNRQAIAPVSHPTHRCTRSPRAHRADLQRVAHSGLDRHPLVVGRDHDRQRGQPNREHNQAGSRSQQGANRLDTSDCTQQP